MKTPRYLTKLAPLVLLALAGGCANLLAAASNWQVGGVDTNWNTVGNWSSGSLTNNTTSAIFGLTSGNSYNATVNVPSAAAVVIFGADSGTLQTTTGTFTLGGASSVLTLSGGTVNGAGNYAIWNNTDKNQTINGPVTVSSSTNATLTVGTAGTGNLTLGGRLTGSLGVGTISPALNAASGSKITLGGGVTGSSFSIVGAGTVEITGASDNAWTGMINMSVTSTKLNLGNATALGGGYIRTSATAAGSNATIDNTSGADMQLTGTNQKLQFTNSVQTLIFTGTKSLDTSLGATDLVVGNSGTQNITVGNNTLTLGKITDSGSYTNQAISKTGAGTLAIAGNVTLAGTYTSGTTSFLTVAGANAGTLTLSGDNSATAGGVTISSTATNSTLNIGNAGALGNGTLNLKATSMTLDNSKGSALTLTTNNVQVWGNGGSAAIIFTGSNDLNLGTGSVTFGGAFASSHEDITVNNTNTLTVGGTISAVGGSSNAYISKSGAGTLVLSGNISIASSTAKFVSLSAGTLTLSGDNSATAGGVTVTAGNGATLNINNAKALGLGTLALSAGVGNSTTIDNKSSGGSLFTTVATTNALTFGTTNVIFTGTNDLNLGTGAATLATNTTLNTTASTLTIGGAIGGGAFNIIKSGAGSLVLSGASTYNGSTTVSAGRLVAGTDSLASTNGAFGNAAGNIVLGDGSTAAGDAPSLLINGAYTVGRNILVGSNAASTYTATIGGSNTTGTSTYNGSITLNATATNYSTTLQAATGGTVEFKTGSWTTNNKTVAIGSSGNLGTVKLSNALATTGGITVNYGTLQAGAASRFGATTPMTVNNGSTLDIGTYDQTLGTVTLTSGNITGSGGNLTGTSFAVQSGTISAKLAGATATLAKSNSGTVTLTGANTFGGATTITAGTLLVNGAGTLGGTSGVTVSGTGKLQLGANDAIRSAATLDLAGGTFDAQTFTNSLGILTLSANSTFDLGSGATISFADSHSASWGSNKLALNGFVSGSSLRFGTTNAGLSAGQLLDFSATGVTAFDLNSSGYLIAVPEPATWGLLAFSLTTVLVLRRRRNS